MRKDTYRGLSPCIKQKILDRDLICVYCGGIPTCVDHVVPWSYSKCNDEYNLVASCELCNHIAYNFIFKDFTEKRLFILKKRNTRRFLARTEKDMANCNSCHQPFHPGINGSGRFTCANCIKLEYFPNLKISKNRKLGVTK